MDDGGEDLLAGAGLTQKQHGHVVVGHADGILQHLPHRRALGDDVHRGFLHETQDVPLVPRARLGPEGAFDHPHRLFFQLVYADEHAVGLARRVVDRRAGDDAVAAAGKALQHRVFLVDAEDDRGHQGHVHALIVQGKDRLTHRIFPADAGDLLVAGVDEHGHAVGPGNVDAGVVIFEHIRRNAVGAGIFTQRIQNGGERDLVLQHGDIGAVPVVEDLRLGCAAHGGYRHEAQGVTRVVEQDSGRQIGVVELEALDVSLEIVGIDAHQKLFGGGVAGEEVAGAVDEERVLQVFHGGAFLRGICTFIVS